MDKIINVKYTAQLRKAAGVAEQKIYIHEKDTLQNLLKKLCQNHSDDLKNLLFDQQAQYRNSVLIVHNGSQIHYHANSALQSGDTILLISPISGG